MRWARRPSASTSSSCCSVFPGSLGPASRPASVLWSSRMRRARRLATSTSSSGCPAFPGCLGLTPRPASELWIPGMQEAMRLAPSTSLSGCFVCPTCLEPTPGSVSELGSSSCAREAGLARELWGLQRPRTMRSSPPSSSSALCWQPSGSPSQAWARLESTVGKPSKTPSSPSEVVGNHLRSSQSLASAKQFHELSTPSYLRSTNALRSQRSSSISAAAILSPRPRLRPATTAANPLPKAPTAASPTHGASL
mmetsp:Transcript_50825/g.162652  ORF Transcript_50825/g.162652 Transcript_50825/m.162652 type:complete len:252 (-) Transcript_50825:238-993(-)